MGAGFVGEHERANEKLDEAIGIYRRCCAGEPWIDRVQALRGPASTSQSLPTESTEQQTQAQNEGVFHREGDIWTITYGGQTLRLSHFKALSYHCPLVGTPGRGIPRS
ncbi:MAG: hypothetical protein C5B58_12035 [Acidobacteria bacterium]|nr:MAG: hypothetical protein C5B58_12035 [Acidobacteriota bacterium]